MSIVISGGKPTAAKAWPLAGSAAANPGTIPQARAVPLLGGYAAVGYETLYRTQPWVYIVVNKLARGIARLPWGAFDISEEGNAERDLAGQLDALLNHPYPRGSAFKLKEFIVSQMAIHGNALVVKWRPRAGQAPEEIWPVDWRWIEPVRSEGEPIAYYRFNGGERSFLADDCVHFQWYGTAGAGVSPLEPLRKTLQTEDAAARYGIANFTNAVRPSGALIHPARMRKEQEEALQARIDAMHAGVDNSFRMLLLSGGMDWKPFGYPASDSELINTRKLTREEVAAVYDIPPPAIGILDHATFSNVSEQHRMLYQDTYGPWLENISDTMDVQLVLPETVWTGQEVRFDLNEMLKGSPQERAAAYAQFRISSVYTANELRRMEGLPRIEDPIADAILVPLNMKPVGEGIEQAAPAQDAQAAELSRMLLAAALAPTTNGG